MARALSQRARAGASRRGGAAIRARRWRPKFACSPAELREARPAPGPPFRPPPPPGPRPPALGPPAPPSGWRPRFDVVRHAADPIADAVGGVALRRACGLPAASSSIYLNAHPAAPEEAVPPAGSPARRPPALSSPPAPPPALPGAQPGRSHSSLLPGRLQRCRRSPPRGPGSRRPRAPSAQTELGARGPGDASTPPPSAPPPTPDVAPFPRFSVLPSPPLRPLVPAPRSLFFRNLPLAPSRPPRFRASSARPPPGPPSRPRPKVD